jgi:hypothetical protein
VRLLQHPAVLVLLCFSLVGTPVTYRGGASNPHPHTFIEFLMEAESGQFDHHHQGGAGETEAHDDSGHHHAGATRTSLESGVRSPVKTSGNMQDDTSFSLRTEPLTTEESPAPGLRTPDQFVASVSVFVVSDVGQLAFILPDHALPQTSQVQTAFAPVDRILSGIAHSPPPPPPR